MKATQLCPTLCSPWDSPGQNTGVGSLSLLQGIFPTQGSNPGLPHCRWILYQLRHEGSPRILEWVAYSFSSGSSEPRNWTKVSCIAGRFFTNWAIKEAPKDLPAAAAAKSLQSCPTLCDTIDGSPPGSPVPGILQARTLEWVKCQVVNGNDLLPQEVENLLYFWCKFLDEWFENN